MSTTTLNLYELLPAIYRIRDANQGGALQNLFAILQDTHDAIDQDIAALYENWFIETCAEWVVPYIGDLLGVPPLSTTAVPGITARAYVAHTLSYRRRKGTPIVLQQLCQDVTNWPTTVVQFFQYLSTTQYMNHVRLQNLATPDLRNVDLLQTLNGPFDTVSHTLDVRGITGPMLAGRLNANAGTEAIPGKYNLPNLGLFVWRLKSYAIEGVSPRPADATNVRYRFNPVGLDEPLFNQPAQPPAAFTPVTTEIGVPGPLRRRALYDELEARRQAMVDQQVVWEPNTNYSLGYEIVDSNGNTQRVISAGESGTSEPTWETTLLSDTGDHLVTWQLASLGSSLPAAYFGENPVFQVFPSTTSLPVPPEQIMICDLSDLLPPSPASTWRTPASSKTYTRASDGAQVTLPLQCAVDPELGRLAFVTQPPNGPAEVLVDYSYAFSGDIGGGPYNRLASVQAMLSGVNQKLPSYWQVAVSQILPAQPNLVYINLADAIAAWNALPSEPERFGVIVLLENGSSHLSGGTEAIVIPEGNSLLIVSSDWPSLTVNNDPTNLQLSPDYQRTHIIGNLQVEGTAPQNSQNPGSLSISGLLLEGSLYIAPGNLGSLSITDCTMVPSAGGISPPPAPTGTGRNADLTITLQNSVCGPISLPKALFSGLTLQLTNCILDPAPSAAALATSPSPYLTIQAVTANANIQACTILGDIGTKTASGLRTLTTGNSIYVGPVYVERRQAGCIRYCVLPTATSRVPQRFRCQPDLALAAASSSSQSAVQERLTPAFTSATYGDPGYAQLSSGCAAEIRSGADDGSEMGAFYLLKQPQRESNLRSVIPNYLRFGMQTGLFYVT